MVRFWCICFLGVLVSGMVAACEKCEAESTDPVLSQNVSDNLYLFPWGDVTATRYPAMLCSQCGFGNKKNNCVKCGKWVASSGVPAFLCSQCGFGNKKDNCVKCGKWVASSGVPAFLCSQCGFGNKKDNCVKCGKWGG